MRIITVLLTFALFVAGILAGLAGFMAHDAFAGVVGGLSLWMFAGAVMAYADSVGIWTRRWELRRNRARSAARGRARIV